ncbi:MAG: peptide transporter [Candidatus Latescibacterota bacterium]
MPGGAGQRLHGGPAEGGGAAPQEHYALVPEETPYESGFNARTVWASLFVGFVMLPGAIYLGLVTGQSMGGASEWVTIILFLEILKRAFIRLRTQEIIILYWVAGGLIAIGVKLGTGAILFGGPFAGPIWDQYFVQSPQAQGLAEHVPDWLVPPPDSEALVRRTFLHPAWIKPVAVLAAVMVLVRVNSLSLGYVMFRLTSDLERLPFPMAPVQAGGATALAETSGRQEGWRWRVFSAGAVIGLLWGAVYVVVPTLSGVFLTQTVQVLDIPFVDLTDKAKSILPAAMLGIGTDLYHVFVGLVLPYWVVVGTFLAAVLSNFVANPLLYRAGVLHTWSPGMSTIPTKIANDLDFYLSFGIGTSLVVAGAGLVLTGRALWRARGERGRGAGTPLPAPQPGRGDLPLSAALAIWGASTALFVVLVWALVPRFPWWISAAFGFLWTPLSSYIGARMIGLTGSPYGSSIPYLKEASFYLSGYQGAAVWFAPIPIFDHGGTAATFRQLELTRTTFGSLVKLTVLTLVVMLVCSFLFWSAIWRLAPIPSAAYPFVQRMWPLEATFQAMWVKSTLPGGSSLIRDIVRWPHVLAGLGFGTTLYLLLAALRAPTILFYGFIGGLGTWPHFALPQMAGALLSRHWLARRFGEERWSAYAPILLAGYSCGMGLIGMTSVGVVLIAKAVSQVVY